MLKVAQFYKVSKQQFEQDWNSCFPQDGNEHRYDAIQLPLRATIGSAGYDIFAPLDFTLVPNEMIKIPTGIRCQIEQGWVLQLYPRSSLGFSYRLQMNNTVGIVDSDYFESDNEGHIFLKLTNDSKEQKLLHIKAGQGIAQGIFLPFGITHDDDVITVRNGGFGSTNKEKG